MKRLIPTVLVLNFLVHICGCAGVFSPSAKVRAIDVDRIVELHQQNKLEPSCSGHKPSVVIGVRSQESILWYSKKRSFQIVDLVPCDEDKNKEKEKWYPFYRTSGEMVSEKKKNSLWVLSSGPAKTNLPFHLDPQNRRVIEYKPFIQLFDANGKPDGLPIDPHIAVRDR